MCSQQQTVGGSQEDAMESVCYMKTDALDRV